MLIESADRQQKLFQKWKMFSLVEIYLYFFFQHLSMIEVKRRCTLELKLLLNKIQSGKNSIIRAM